MNYITIVCFTLLFSNLSDASFSSNACNSKKTEFIEQRQCTENKRFLGGQYYLTYNACATAADFSARITSSRVETQGVVSTHFLCTVTETTHTTKKIFDYREFPKTNNWKKRNTTRVYSSDDSGSKLYLTAANGEELECTSSEKYDHKKPKNITWQKCFYKKTEMPALRLDQLSAIYDGRFSVEEALKLPDQREIKTCDPQKPGDCVTDVKPNIFPPNR